MAKQLELRRGTTQANNLFTGAAGEVTMDTDTKQLRVHDGVKTGGYAVDTLVAFQVPSAGNNYTWYRKYASGWVEQGGVVSGSGAQTINLPVTMADNNYQVYGNVKNATNGSATFSLQARTLTTTTAGVYKTYNGGQAGEDFWWEVKGMAAA